jgi:hypothetical protein
LASPTQAARSSSKANQGSTSSCNSHALNALAALLIIDLLIAPFGIGPVSGIGPVNVG